MQKLPWLIEAKLGFDEILGYVKLSADKAQQRCIDTSDRRSDVAYI